MKTLILTTLALAAGIALTHAQGTVSIETTASEVYTNNGIANGPATGASGTFIFEVLDMTQGAWSGLSPVQQLEAYGLFTAPSAINLWTDSGVSGINSTLHPGGINAVVDAVAANWAAPTSDVDYSTASSYDYYTIVELAGQSWRDWSQISSDLQLGLPLRKVSSAKQD